LQLIVAIVVIVVVLGILVASGRTTLSRTSRAAAYVTLADLIEGKVWKRQAWPRALAEMLAILLVHVLGLAAFVLLLAFALYLILQNTAEVWHRP